MRLLSILFLAMGLSVAQTYTATNLQPANSPYQIANVLGLNNQGQVLLDICNNGNCVGVNRGLGVWSNGMITPLPFPVGYTYSPEASFYHINDSGTVLGVGGSPSGSKAIVWTNGVPAVLPDAPYTSDFGGPDCPSSTNGSSVPSGINAAGHIVGSTNYRNPNTAGPCSANWVYNGSSFRTLPFPEPQQCLGLPATYGGGVNVYLSPVMNDADQVLETVQNVFCGPPYANPNPPFPAEDPAIIQPNRSYSFLSLGALSAAGGSSINDIGDVLGFYGTNGSSGNNLVIWDKNGVHPLGNSTGGYLNQVGQVLYRGSGLAIWQNGVSTPVQLPAGLVAPSPGPEAFNDAGQMVIGSGNGFTYLLTPTGPCAQDVTSQVQITQLGFRYNHSTGLFALLGSVTNTSGSPIPGPISLVVDNLSSNASLFSISGATLCAAPQGSSYINIGNIADGQTLMPGASISGSISFINTAQTGITYSLRVLAGPGGR